MKETIASVNVQEFRNDGKLFNVFEYNPMSCPFVRHSNWILNCLFVNILHQYNT